MRDERLIEQLQLLVHLIAGEAVKEERGEGGNGRERSEPSFFGLFQLHRDATSWHFRKVIMFEDQRIQHRIVGIAVRLGVPSEWTFSL